MGLWGNLPPPTNARGIDETIGELNLVVTLCPLNAQGMKSFDLGLKVRLR
jgi:hypothetical protein